ncbi:YbaK/EbsC family protein [Vibrio sp. D404a]|uniref:aminoacyl-tRNA deacylase n=1 Tax=unclassified Vibrio TaxID=2614977 RepID=UPI002553EA13|nr:MULTISPECIES: YbaK/EbsC family protein [unclassified Vibrio]MDK9739562.1 YbaK/EbsC family protein [Vibrio sp. D404a]MDK9797245.1 YbaK/EbsC family protein [Vibrio sp. D449a]
MQTVITDWLDQQQVEYRLLLQDKETTSIEETAQARGIEPSQMVKCILLRDMGNQYALACAPGDKAIDPKKVRAVLNCRRMTCVSQQDVESVTGFKVGCVGPLALKRHMPIIFDPSLQQNKIVTISSGERMAGIALDLNDLMNLCAPISADICR